MLSSGAAAASAEKRDFDAFASSMSAVIQELYALTLQNGGGGATPGAVSPADIFVPSPLGVGRKEEETLPNEDEAEPSSNLHCAEISSPNPASEFPFYVKEDVNTFSDENGAGPKMEDCVSPLRSREYVYGERERRTDHSYCRRDEDGAEKRDGNGVRREDEEESGNGVALQNGVRVSAPLMGQSVISEVEPLLVKPLVTQSVISEVEPLLDKASVTQSVISEVEPLLDKASVTQSVISEVEPLLDKASVTQSVISEVEPLLVKPSVTQSVISEVEPKRLLKRRLTLDIGRHFSGVSFRPAQFGAKKARVASSDPAPNPDVFEKRAEGSAIVRLFSDAAAKLRNTWFDGSGDGGDRVFVKFTSPSFWIFSLESAAMFVCGSNAVAPWIVTRVRTPSEWSFAFVWSQDVDPAPFCTNADAVRRPASGLQTVMALFFPGCWRLLARKRRPAGRAASVRKLAFLRFGAALKDADPSVPFFSPFGADSPLWDRLDPPSEIATLRLPRCADSETATLSTPRRGFALHDRCGLSFRASFPNSNAIRESARSRLRIPAPEFAPRPSDEADAAVPAFPESDRAPRRESESEEKKPKKVSQIRIRKTVPKPDPNLTPMGLPRPKRLKKTEFSLEEIYTNKNYKSPPATRSLETIFEEPKERNGSLVSVSQQKRKRVLEFQDFTVPRKRKTTAVRGWAKAAAGGFTRAQRAAAEGRELDGLLIQRLTDLETFLAEQDGAAADALRS